jgi:mRNA interferase MazF
VSTVEIGEVFLVDLGEPIGHEQGFRRPAVVISPQRYNATPSQMVVVVPVTNTNRGLAHHVPLDHTQAGLRQPSVARCEDMGAISQRRLLRCLGRVTPADLDEIRETVRILLEL